MAGTTTNYNLQYPTSGDLVRNGATAIQTLADGVDTNLAVFADPGVETTVNPGTPSTTTSTSYIVTAGNSANTVVHTLGASGIALVILTCDMSNSTTAQTSGTLSFSGAMVQSASQYRAVTVFGTGRQTGTAMFIVSGTAKTDVNCILNWRVSSGTGTMHSSRIYAINLG